MGPLIPLFGLLVTSPLGFKVRVGSLIHAWKRCACYTIPEFTSSVTPADLLAASMAAELISSMYLRTGIGEAQNWDLSWPPLRQMLCCYIIIRVVTKQETAEMKVINFRYGSVR